MLAIPSRPGALDNSGRSGVGAGGGREDEADADRHGALILLPAQPFVVRHLMPHKVCQDSQSAAKDCQPEQQPCPLGSSQMRIVCGYVAVWIVVHGDSGSTIAYFRN